MIHEYTSVILCIYKSVSARAPSDSIQATHLQIYHYLVIVNLNFHYQKHYLNMGYCHH